MTTQKLGKWFFNPASLSVILIATVNLFSKFLGFIRQFLIWDKLDSLRSDLLLSSAKIPEFLLVFLLMGTVYSSVLPVASRLDARDNSGVKTSKYLSLVFYLLNLVLLVFVVFLWVFTEPVLQLFTSGEVWKQAMEASLIDDYILVSRILLIIPFVSAFQSILGIFLTMRKKFFIFSLAGTIANLGTIYGLLVSQGDIVKISLSMVWGWLVVDALFLLVALRSGFEFKSLSLITFISDLKNFKADLMDTLKTFLPRIFLIDGFYFSSFLINPLTTSKGQITAYDIGISIQSSFFILITAIGTVFFPHLSKIFFEKKFSEIAFWNTLFKYLRVSLLLGTVVAVFTFLVSPLVMEVYSLAGKGQNNKDLIVFIAQISSVSLIFRAGKEILSKYFYIKERVFIPLILSTTSLISQAFVTLFLFYAFRIETVVAVTAGLIVNEVIWMVLAWLYLRKDNMLFLAKQSRN